MNFDIWSFVLGVLCGAPILLLAFIIFGFGRDGDDGGF